MLYFSNVKIAMSNLINIVHNLIFNGGGLNLLAYSYVLWIQFYLKSQLGYAGTGSSNNLVIYWSLYMVHA